MRPTATARRLARFVVGLIAAACGDPLGADREVVLGVLAIDAPATFAAGTPIPVTLTVRTGGCLSFRRIEAVRQGADRARLRAIGTDAGGPGVVCTADVRQEQHATSVQPPAGDVLTIGVESPEGDVPDVVVRRR